MGACCCNAGATTACGANPGGGLNPGEDFLSGVRRELLEETGLTVQTLKRVQFLAGPELRFMDHKGVWDSVGMIYQAEGVTGDLRLPEGEITEARWFTLDELESVNLLGVYTGKAVRHWAGKTA